MGPSSEQPEQLLEQRSRHRHKRKKKHSQRNKIPREVIIVLLFILACLLAYGVWDFLVNVTPSRTSAPAAELQPRIKA